MCIILVHDKKKYTCLLFYCISNAYNRGFRPLNPDLLFVLTQKVSKKVKTAPTSFEKLALNWLKPSKLAPTKYVGTQTGLFLPPISLVFRLTGRGQSVSEKLWHKYARQIQDVTQI